MTRVSILGFCLVNAWLLFVSNSRGQESSTQPPNIVMIISDDQAWTDFGFMGHPHIQTPNIDRLASESITFRRGYVPSSLCSPSLATILSGLYPHQHGITSNDPPRGDDPNRSPGGRGPAFLKGRERLAQMFDAIPSLPKRLAELGYLSLQTGKWWGGNYRNGGFTHGMTHGDPSRGGRHGDAGLDIGRKGLEPIEDFIHEATDQQKPFLVWYAPFLPHSPHNPPERLVARYRAVAPSEQHARYLAMCEWLDETVGQLREILKETSTAENTVLMFVVDNGWIQDPEADRYAPRSKQSPYDGGLRTPILIHAPKRFEPRVVDTPVSSIDLVPTALAVAGLPIPDDLPGINLTDPEAVESRGPVFGECFTHDAVDLDDPAASLRWRWIVDGDWKLIVPSKANEPDAPVELFSILDDPLESRNVHEAHPEVVQKLREKLDAWWPGDTASQSK